MKTSITDFLKIMNRIDSSTLKLIKSSLLKNDIDNAVGLCLGFEAYEKIVCDLSIFGPEKEYILDRSLFYDPFTDGG